MINSISLDETHSFFVIIVVWLIVLAVLYMVHKAQNAVGVRESQKETLRRLVPFLELIILLTTFIWTGWKLLAAHSDYLLFFVIFVAALLLWMLRFALYDITAGIVLKTENLYKVGDTIIFDNISCTINSVGFRCLTVLRSDGKYIKIPYHHLATVPLFKPTASGFTRSHSFSLSFPFIDEIPEQIKTLALNAPWSLPNAIPGVELVETGETHSTYQITVFSLDARYFSKIEHYIRSNLESLVSKSDQTFQQ